MPKEDKKKEPIEILQEKEKEVVLPEETIPPVEKPTVIISGIDRNEGRA